MLKNTFIHIPGIGSKTEACLWDSGILDWDGLRKAFEIKLSHKKLESIERCLQESREHLGKNSPQYFNSLLPTNQHWRMFPEFRDSTVYLDIETTGLKVWGSEITTIALFDGEDVFYYVKDQNLDDFVKDIMKYKLIITSLKDTITSTIITVLPNLDFEQIHNRISEN